MLSRHLLTVALLVLAASAQAMTPNRHGANGGGASCPDAQAEAATYAAPSAVLAAEGGAADATVAAGAAPAPAKAANGSRVKAGTRWHSFLPGMFK